MLAGAKITEEARAAADSLIAEMAVDDDISEIDRQEVAAELQLLAIEIAARDARYYQEDDPTVTDAEYDGANRNKQLLETAFPHLVA